MDAPVLFLAACRPFFAGAAVAAVASIADNCVGKRCPKSYRVAHWSKSDRVKDISPEAPGFTRPYRLVGGPARLSGRLRKRRHMENSKTGKRMVSLYRPGRLGAAQAARATGAGLYRPHQWYS